MSMRAEEVEDGSVEDLRASLAEVARQAATELLKARPDGAAVARLDGEAVRLRAQIRSAQMPRTDDEAPLSLALRERDGPAGGAPRMG